MKDIFDFVFVIILDIVSLFAEFFIEYKYIFLPALVSLGGFLLYEIIKTIRNLIYK